VGYKREERSKNKNKNNEREKGKWSKGGISKLIFGQNGRGNW
jgi:hypothetical protein